jgi:iron(III) transport system permease protein
MTAIATEPPKVRRRFRKSEPLAIAMLVCVAVVCLAILALLAVILWLSVVEGSPGVETYAYTLKNFTEMLTDNRIAGVLVDTLWFSVVSLVVAMAFCLPAAWLAERTNIRGKTLLYTMMTIGMIIPGFAAAMGWLFLMHPRIGLLNVLATRTFGFTSAPFDIATVVGMGWVQGLNLAPLAFIMTAAVFGAMDPSLEEAAQMSRANPLRTMLRVTLPLASPGIMAAAIYIFTIGFAAFDVPVIIGWSNRIFTFSTFLYLLISPQDVLPKYGVAAALSTIVMILAAALSWWYGAMQKRSRRFAVVTGKAYRPKLHKLGWAAYPAWIFLGLFFFLSTILPIVLLAWSSSLPFFQMPSAMAFKLASFNHYRGLPWDLVLTGVSNTVILMILTPTLTLLVSIAFSWAVLRSKIPGRAFFDFIAFLPHAIPSIIFGVGALLVTLYVLQRAVPIYGTIWILLLVFTITRISYATRMTNSGFIQLHTELEESAQMSGASMPRVFRRILVPLLSPTLLYAWLWIALLTFRELTLAAILTSGDNTTLPMVIWGLWQGGGLGQASALAMIMLAAMAPVIALYWMIARRSGLMAAS